MLWHELTAAKWNASFLNCGISLFECDSTFPLLKGSYELKMIVIGICLEGRLQMKSTDTHLTLSQGDAMVCMPGTILIHEQASPDLRIRAFCLSPDVVARDSAKKGYFTKFTHRRTPYVIIHFDATMMELLQSYCTILKIKTTQSDVTERDLTVSSIVSCMLSDILSRIPGSHSVQAIKNTQGYKSAVFQNFISLATKDTGSLRSVKEYANALGVTPKYLSAACRDSSGKSAKEWINEFLSNEISRLLRYSDLSIKEISSRLNFPNCSVFSKYLRQHFDMSGIELRKRLRSED